MTGDLDAANRIIVAAVSILEAQRSEWLVDIIPAYASLVIEYDPARAAAEDAFSLLHAAMALARQTQPTELAPRSIRIPVLYHPSVAPDLLSLAADKGMTPDQLAAAHAAGDYRVYAVGFRPGFPFMGFVAPALAAPRLATPRSRVVAGSVGIAGRQTGVYPNNGPGGWRIIGRTPLRMFDPERVDPFTLRTGDHVQFVAITAYDWRRLTGAPPLYDP